MRDFIFLGSKITVDRDCSHKTERHTLEKKSYYKSRQCIKKQRYHFADKGPYSQSYCFSNSHVEMWELDHKEGWAPKNWCFQIIRLEKTLESPLDSKIKPVNTKGEQPWIFSGRTDTEVEAPILWPPDVKNRLTGEHCDAGNDRGEGGNRGWDGWMASWT